MSSGLREGLKRRIERLQCLPSSPAVLQPLLELLRQPTNRINVKRVVQLVSYDKTIAAQCLRIANSPLYGRVRETDSIHAAVVSLGIHRVEDILLTCCLHQFSAGEQWATDPAVFWRHSLGCAAVSRELAERIDYSDPDRAYLSGLLHDLGILVNSLAYPQEYGAVLAAAAAKGVPLDEQELHDLEFTHCESGRILASLWKLPLAVNEVIAFHHHPAKAPAGNPVVALVHIADVLCRLRGLGYGYEEWRSVDLAGDPAWEILAKHCPQLGKMDLARFTMDLDAYVPRVQALVESVFTTKTEQPEVAPSH
ncbi:MAG TPA: HDOD domain-containing protein [Candidatus Sulfotelmatobacter sp.]|nr:HDOD domain-containing protein [Candidatus Sulfotelmatobacter sp.]